MKYKYKCPNCGSTKLSWWYEDIIETRYKCKANGEPYKTVHKKFFTGADGHSGLVCEECGEFVNFSNNDFTDWENK